VEQEDVMTEKELIAELADALEDVLSTDQNEDCWPARSDEADMVLAKAREWLEANP
jgi:hypothetical protein